jgi:hypothetical protein
MRTDVDMNTGLMHEMQFNRDFLKSIDWKLISDKAETQAMSDMRLTSYFDEPENFSVIIDFSYREDDQSGPNGLTNFLRVIIRTDADATNGDIQETVNDYVLDNYVMPAFQAHIESLGIDWEEFYEDWLMGYPGPDFDIPFNNDIDIDKWSV